jgi:hypothetical protein
MNKRYKSFDNIEVKGSSLSIKNIFHSGGKNIIMGPKFDIKQYLKEIDRNHKDTSPRRANNNKLTLLYPIITPKNVKLYNISTDSNNISPNSNNIYHTIENESSVSAMHRNKCSFNTNYSSKNIYQGNQMKNKTLSNQENNCFITSLGIEQKEINNKHKTIDSNDYMITLRSHHNNRLKRIFNFNKQCDKNKNYHIESIIKEIKEKYKTKNDKDIKNDYLAYKTENLDAVLDSKKLLNDYVEKNEWTLKLDERNIEKFKLNNEKIYKNNVLTKLVNKERDKVMKNDEDYMKKIKDKKSTIIDDEKLFENLIDEQKQNNKIIDDYRIKLEEMNRELYYIKDAMYIKVQNKEGEIMKKLFEMEELRTYAKFVNNMLGNDDSRYDKTIYPIDYDRKIDPDILVRNVFEIYDDYLTEKNNLEEDDNYPELIYKGFLGLEDKIRYGINLKDREYEKITKLKKNNDAILKHINEKKNFLEEQYNTTLDECNIIKTEISKERKEDTYFYDLAQDFFNYTLEIFDYENYTKNKDNSILNLNLNKLSDLAEKTKNCITEKEIFINNSIKIIEQYEKENPILFEEIIDLTKSKIILQNQKEAKKMAKIKERIKKIQAIKKLEKINFIIRKMEKPFHVKKKEKVIKDLKTIQEMENRELMTYQ